MAAPEEWKQNQEVGVQISTQVIFGDQSMDVLTRDMTKTGICLASAKELVPGSLIKVALSLVLGQNSFSEPLALSGKVLWCTPLPHNMFQIGVSYTGMDPQKLGYLDMFLRLLQKELVLEIPSLTGAQAGGNGA